MYIPTLSLTSALDGSGRSTPRPGRFNTGNGPINLVEEARWAPGPVWTVGENHARTGIHSSDRQACSESPYGLHYRGPHIFVSLYFKRETIE